MESVENISGEDFEARRKELRRRLNAHQKGAALAKRALRELEIERAAQFRGQHQGEAGT